MPDVKKGKVLFMDGRHADAAREFLSAAREGDAEGAFNYAFCLQFGFGVEKNESLARSFYSYSIEKIGEASYNLAVLYLHGVGVERDYKKSYSYMYEAAKLGVIEAQLYLGVAHTMGTMFEPDIVAISLIPYHTPIARDSGLMLPGDVPDEERDEEARIAAVDFDLNAAHRWFRVAAKNESEYTEQLSVQSKYLYARCFVDGVGTDYNRQRAEDLMLVAADAGSVDALAFLNENAPYRLPELRDKEQIQGIRRVFGLPTST